MTTTPTWQPNSECGWMLMGLYWCAGWIVGVLCHYFPLCSAIGRPRWTVWHVQALVATAIARYRLHRRYTSCGRTPDFSAALLFGVCNGTAETALFLAAHDLGRHCLSQLLGLKSKVWADTVGMATFFAYSAAIHALFWLPHALPQHVKDGAPPFVSVALPLLTLMSASWVLLYENTGDVGFLCTLHALVDVSHALSIALPRPDFRSCKSRSNPSFLQMRRIDPMPSFPASQTSVTS